MKNVLNYYYNINVTDVVKEGDVYTFDLNYTKYYFVPLLRPLEDLPLLNDLANEMFSRGILTHTFMFNKDNLLYTVYNEQHYCLLKINNNLDKEITLNDVNNFHSNLRISDTNSKLKRTDWATLWSEKIDYFEYQIRQLGIDKKIIINSFSYYIGLAENAIAYVNNISLNLTSKINGDLTVCHRRIFNPNISLNFLNPLSYVIDYDVRDIAEYIKVMFFSNEYDWYEIENYINRHIFTPYSCAMFYARLLYPSYYFDVYEKVMSEEVEERELLKIIDNVDNYEIFLKDIYDLLSKKKPIPRIDWIMNKN